MAPLSEPLPLFPGACCNKLHCVCMHLSGGLRDCWMTGGAGWRQEMGSQTGLGHYGRQQMHSSCKLYHIEAHFQLSLCIVRVCVLKVILNGLTSLWPLSRLLYCFNPCPDNHHESFWTSNCPLGRCVRCSHTCVCMCAPEGRGWGRARCQ